MYPVLKIMRMLNFLDTFSMGVTPMHFLSFCAIITFRHIHNNIVKVINDLCCLGFPLLARLLLYRLWYMIIHPSNNHVKSIRPNLVWGYMATKHIFSFKHTATSINLRDSRISLLWCWNSIIVELSSSCL